MSDDEFQSLALKVLAHQATPEENRQLETLLMHDPKRVAELDDLRTTLAITQTTLPLTQALEATTTPLPRYRMQELRSAVRNHFRITASDANTDHRVIHWLQTLWGRLVFGGGLTIAAAILIIAILPAPTEISVGSYAQSLTRSASAEPILNPAKGVQLNQFENDAAFEKWIARPFAKEEKARIWIDEERDQIHVRVRATLFHSQREFTCALPASSTARRIVLEELVKEIQK